MLIISTYTSILEPRCAKSPDFELLNRSLYTLYLLRSQETSESGGADDLISIHGTVR